MRPHAAAFHFIKALSIGIVLGIPLPSAGAALAPQLAITGATIIDGTGKAPLHDGMVLIEDGRITAVGPARAVTVPAGARKLDARGKFVIPGLMDAHVHIVFASLEQLIRYEGRYQDLIFGPVQFTLRNGVTTLFDTWGPREALVKVRDMINAGQAIGSRIYLAGNAVGWGGPFSPDFNATDASRVSAEFVKRTNGTWEQGTGRALLWLPPEQLRPVVREYLRKDIDFLKYAGTSHNTAHFSYPTFSPRQQKVIVEEGRRAGFSVQAHTLSVETLDMAVDAGVDIVAHGDNTGPVASIPDETIRKLVDRKVAVAIRPFRQKFLDDIEAREKANPLPASWGEASFFVGLMKNEKINQRKMIKAGVTTLFSTDGVPVSHAQAASDPGMARFALGEAHFDALVALEEDGMDRMEILKSATSNIAKAYKLDARIGTVEAGKIADLLILDRDPLDSAQNYRSIHAVIKDGKVVDRERLSAAAVSDTD